jgi:hypothetical protein
VILNEERRSLFRNRAARSGVKEAPSARQSLGENCIIAEAHSIPSRSLRPREAASSLANASGTRAIRFPARNLMLKRRCGVTIARRETNPFDPPDYPVDGARRRRAFNLQISSGLQIGALRLARPSSSLSVALSLSSFAPSLRCSLTASAERGNDPLSG